MQERMQAARKPQMPLLRCRRAAWRSCCTTTMMAPPMQMEPNWGPRACPSDRIRLPRKSVCSAGAKYHCGEGGGG